MTGVAARAQDARERLNPSATMLLLTYTPRADAEARGYERWLREVDNPFFNAVPGIVHYTNWKVTQPKIGALGFTHFDTMFIEDAAAFERAFLGEEVRRFADGWVEQWGVAPEAGHAPVNYQVLLAELLASPAEGTGARRTPTCLLLPNTPRADARADGYDAWLREVDNPFFNRRPELAGYTNWKVTEAKLGAVEFTDFDLIYVDGPDGFERAFVESEPIREFAAGWVERWGREPGADLASGVNFSAALAEVIAAP